MSDEQPIDIDDLRRVSSLVRGQTADNWLADMVEIAAAEIERLRYSLAIYVHAHKTDNAVPPSIESAAVTMLGSGHKKAGVEVGDE